MGADGNRSVTIMVAVIGVVGVLGSAVIANWDKLTGKAAVQNPTPTVPGNAVSGVPDNKPVVKQDPPPATDSNNQDSLQVVAISPPKENGLPSNHPFAVTMRLHYRLVSADSMLLVPFLERYGAEDKCASGNHRTIASNDPSQIPIKRGEGDVSVVFKVDADPKTKPSNLGNEGYVAPNASFWAGFDSQNRVIVSQEMLLDSTKYCYRFSPQ